MLFYVTAHFSPPKKVGSKFNREREQQLFIISQKRFEAAQSKFIFPFLLMKFLARSPRSCINSRARTRNAVETPNALAQQPAIYSHLPCTAGATII